MNIYIIRFLQGCSRVMARPAVRRSSTSHGSGRFGSGRIGSGPIRRSSKSDTSGRGRVGSPNVSGRGPVRWPNPTRPVRLDPAREQPWFLVRDLFFSLFRWLGGILARFSRSGHDETTPREKILQPCFLLEAGGKGLHNT